MKIDEEDLRKIKRQDEDKAEASIAFTIFLLESCLRKIYGKEDREEIWGNWRRLKKIASKRLKIE